MILEVRITGRVQGVWFRAWTKEQADALGLAGWVKNNFDGSVEAHFEGADAAVNEMLVRTHDGPPLARVELVEQQPGCPPCGWADFRIL